MFLLFLLMSTYTYSADNLVLAIDRSDQYLPLLRDKKIALVVNQSSVSHGEHTIDVLRKQGLKIVKLFALEHGVRGEIGAGDDVNDSVDEKTGIPILSLYGKHRKPTKQMLEGVDTILFDIQDVGIRFFTYISSLGNIMDGANEQKIPLIVFDRPNPNGDYIAGPLLEKGLFSFVGAYPIPIVYGLTIGELATMIQGEAWAKPAALKVVTMENYDRNKLYAPEMLPSPNLKNLAAIRLYPSLALFEPTVISVGRGTDEPFLQYGLPEESFGHHRFTPKSRQEAKEPLYQDEICFGETFKNKEISDLPKFTWKLFQSALQKAKKKPFVTDAHFLSLLVGNKSIAKALQTGEAVSEESYAKELSSFDRKRKKYFLY